MKSLRDFITESYDTEGTTSFQQAFRAILGVRSKDGLKKVSESDWVYNEKTGKTATLNELEKAYTGDYSVEWDYNKDAEEITLTTNDFVFVIGVDSNDAEDVCNSL